MGIDDEKWDDVVMATIQTFAVELQKPEIVCFVCNQKKFEILFKCCLLGGKVFRKIIKCSL